MTFWEGRRLARPHLPDAVALVDWAQYGKTALAGVLAWVIARDVLGLDQPFLAPWAAVLVVHATVYRAVSRGGQQIVATFLGVLLAWASGTLFGLGPLGMGAMLVAAFLIGRHRWLEEEVTTIATTGIVVLATNAIDQSHLLAERLLDTAVGVVVGLAVNLAVWPPLRDRAARIYAHELPQHLADTLEQMAEDLRSRGQDLDPSDVEEWLSRCREVDLDVDHAWALLRQAKESSRLNPRRSRPADLHEIEQALHLVEEAVAEAISLARTISTSARDANVWDESFRAQVERLLSATARGIAAGDASSLEEVRDELRRLASDLSTDALAGSHWHEYGGVLVTLRNLVDAGIDLAPWTQQGGRAVRRQARFHVRDRLRRRPHLIVSRRG